MGAVHISNDLEVTPPELDSDAEIREAIGIVLEKEPFVDAAQLVVRVSGGAVTLAGAVQSEEQRRIAEHDVWLDRVGVCGTGDLGRRALLPRPRDVLRRRDGGRQGGRCHRDQPGHQRSALELSEGDGGEGRRGHSPLSPASATALGRWRRVSFGA